MRYQAALAERQFNRVDPDNRLVAAELEQRWEGALRELQQAEAAYTQRQQSQSALPLPPELKAAFTSIGQKLPELWHTDVLNRVQKKSLLRCLIDKVVVHRLGRDLVRTRIVWKGGDTTTADLPIRVGSFADLTGAEALEAHIIGLAEQSLDDQVIAEQLTARGFRSPLHTTLLPSTVKRIRLQHGIMLKRHQSHPRNVPGYLTVSQIAAASQTSTHWIYDRIHNGTITITRDPQTRLYLFPDTSSTLTRFRKLKAGKLQHLRF